MLKGKKGRFRPKFAWQRVDYSGRSVIWLDLSSNSINAVCRKDHGVELYRPFVIARLVQNGYAANVKGAAPF